jgi:hypothetical protein
MSVCVYSIFVLSCVVQVRALRRANPQSRDSYRLYKNDQETEKASKVQQRAIEP